MLKTQTTPPALDGYPVGVFSPTYKMLGEVWRDLKQVCRDVTAKKNEQERRIELITGGVIECWSLEDPDSARGRKYKRVLIDEAAKARYLQDAWEQTIRATLTDFVGDAWFMSTPKGLNYYHALYQRGLTDEDWASWKFPSRGNPHLPAGEIEAARSELPDIVFRQEYLAEFIQNQGAVFRNIQECLTDEDTHPKQHRGHKVVVGIDWGQTGDFTSVSIYCEDCGREVAHDRFNKLDYETQRARIKALCQRWGVGSGYAESNAMGQPNLESLQADGVPVTGFATTAQTKPQIIQSLALAFEKQEAMWIDDAIWTAELQAYEATQNQTTGRWKYSAPQGMHDDTVIARALAWKAAHESAFPFAIADTEWDEWR